MSEPITWYAIGRTVADPELIQEWVDAKLLVHNQDVSAHGQSNEAIWEHREAAILDHIAESVENIKLHPYARIYVAVVDAGGDGDYTDIQDAIDYANTKGGGNILIKRGVYYPASDIVIGMNIDLIGEGMDETIIDFGAANYGIKGYHRFIVGGAQFPICSCTNGSPVVTFPAGTNIITGDDKVWPGMKIIFDTEMGEHIISSVDSETQLTMSDNYTAATGDDIGSIVGIAHFIQNSAVVTFPAGSKLLTDGVLPNFKLFSDDLAYYEFTISSVDSETQLTLNATVDEATDDYTYWIWEDQPPANTIAHLTIKNSTADYVIDCDDKISLNLESIKVQDCVGVLIGGSNETPKCRIENSKFIDNSGEYQFNTWYYDFFHNYIAPSGGVITAFYINQSQTIENNSISMSGCTIGILLKTYGGDNKFNNNAVSGIKYFDKKGIEGGAAQWRATIIGNNISMANTYHCNIYGVCARIQGNTIYTALGGHVYISSSSGWVVMIGNTLNAAVDDDGGTDIVDHNTTTMV